MTANPALTPVTTPARASTVATPDADVVHATGRPGTTAPAAWRGVADRATVAPSGIEGSSGEIETLLVAGGGAVVLSPPHAASAIANARREADRRTKNAPSKRRRRWM